MGRGCVSSQYCPLVLHRRVVRAVLHWIGSRFLHTVRPPPSAKKAHAYVASLASIVIFAFNSLDTGHPVFALLAAASKAWRFAPGILAVTSR
jgi:hypothetical protein